MIDKFTEVDVYKFHIKGIEKAKKLTMTYAEFLKLKSDGYYYRAYQINFNSTILK